MIHEPEVRTIFLEEQLAFQNNGNDIPAHSLTSLSLSLKEDGKRRGSRMEALYLLCSIASATATSVVLSLLLPFRALFDYFFLSSPPHSTAISFYQGHVRHVRRRPVAHAFHYDVRYALIDLDRSPASSFPTHLSAQEARRVSGATGPV